jgi:hypothetical protein
MEDGTRHASRDWTWELGSGVKIGRVYGGVAAKETGDGLLLTGPEEKLGERQRRMDGASPRTTLGCDACVARPKMKRKGIGVA